MTDERTTMTIRETYPPGMVMSQECKHAQHSKCHGGLCWCACHVSKLRAAPVSARDESGGDPMSEIRERLKAQLASNQKHERHANNRETAYWCNQTRGAILQRMKTIRIIIAGVLLFLLGMAWAAESQPPTPDFITVQDVKGQCWQIKPRNFYMKGGMFAFQNTVIFERTPCK